MKFPFLKRETASVSRVQHPSIDIRLFGTEAVTFEADAFEQLFEFTDIARAVDDLRLASPDYLGPDAGIERIVLTPDFHRGSGIPVGTVIRARKLVLPQATGNDICCGMRLLATDMPVELLEPHWVEIRKRLRAIFFEGKRDIPMSPRQREAMLRDGLPGLVATAEDNQTRGIWSRYDARTQRDDLDHCHGHGQLKTSRLFGFESFVKSSGNVDGRDPQIGCVGDSRWSRESLGYHPWDRGHHGPLRVGGDWARRGRLLHGPRAGAVPKIGSCSEGRVLSASDSRSARP